MDDDETGGVPSSPNQLKMMHMQVVQIGLWQETRCVLFRNGKENNNAM